MHKLIRTFLVVFFLVLRDPWTTIHLHIVSGVMLMSSAVLRFCFLAVTAAIAPDRRVAIEQDSMSNLRLLRNLTFPIEGLPPNLPQLQDKIPKGLLGFLRKEDKLHSHHHANTKEQHAQRRANFTLELLRLFRPCASCSRYQRYGSAHDGGYVMCADLTQGTKAIYSFGINGNDDWGAAMAREHDLPVYQFDCYHKGVTCPSGHSCDNSKFFPECLGLPQDDTRIFRSLEEHIQRHSPLHGQPVPRGGDLLLKVDIEGKEWNAFTDARLKDLRRMRQMVVEFHAISHDEFHDSYVQALRRILKAGFLVAHIHGNNVGPMALFGNGRFRIADSVEVTFVNKAALPPAAGTTCRNTQAKLDEDAVGNPFNFDLPIPLLPGENDTITPSHIRVVTCRWWCGAYAHAMYIGPFVLGSGFMLTWIIVVVFLLAGSSTFEFGKSFGLAKGVPKKTEAAVADGGDI